MEIGKHISLPSTTGGSFDVETRDLLAARCKLAHGVAFVVSLVAWLFYQLVLNLEAKMAVTPFVARNDLIYLLYPLAFWLAVVAFFVRKWTTSGLMVIDHIVMTFTILLSALTAAVLLPTRQPIFEVSILLFVHAAIIPVRVRYQAGLAVTIAVGYPLAMVLSNAFVPGIQDFWGANGGRGAFRDTTMEGTFALTTLAVVSVLLTHTLYGMRKSLRAAKRLGNYLIERELGKGGMGQVYLAQHALMCRPTAIKTMQDTAAESPAELARFEREVRLSATLTHPNTITIYDFGRTADNAFYYAMEYLEGLDLQALVERFGPVLAERTVFVLRQVCGSLGEAHDRGIVHRDVKPSNIFLTHRGGLYDFAKVLDFGLAKQIRSNEAATVTKTGMLFGTPRYLAPEMVYGSEEIDGRADLYNVGGIAYWMITGQPPFASSSSVEVIIDHVKTTPTRPSKISELPIPRDLDDLIMKCLEKKPGDRYQTASELDAALAAIHFDGPWSQEKAKQWWGLHAPDDARVAECVCKAEEGSRLMDLGQPVATA